MNDINQFSVRLPNKEYNILYQEAEERGITFAAYVRYLLQLHIDRNDLEEKIEKVVERQLKEKLSRLLED